MVWCFPFRNRIILWPQHQAYDSRFYVLRNYLYWLQQAPAPTQCIPSPLDPFTVGKTELAIRPGNHTA